MGFESKTKLCGVALALLMLAGAAQASDATKAIGHKKWSPWIELGGYGSNEESRGEAIMFAPLWQSTTALLFADIRGKVFEKDEFEGNAAMGLRAMQPSGWNLGAWVGWDIRNTEFDNTFNQVAFGFEAIRPDFDVRVNGYIPTDDREFVARSDTFAALLAGNSIFVQQTSDIVREYALYGIDGEVGLRVPLELWDTGLDSNTYSGAPRHELRLYGGGFWFDQDDFEGEVAGPRARLEWRVNDIIQPILGSRLTIEAEYQYDEVRDHQFEAGARLRIPFGGGGLDARNAALASLTAQERRMMDGLERDVDIVVEKQTDTTQTLENAIDNETNVLFERVAYVGDGGDLQGTIDGTGQNSLVLITGGTLAGNVETLANQTLQGGASTIFIRGARTGVVLPFTAPGSKPTLQAGNDLDVLIIGGSNVHIAGLGIDGLNGTSDEGIEARGNRTNIVLQQNMIFDIGDKGIDFEDGNSNIRIFNNMITNTGGPGIELESNNTDITIRDNEIRLARDNAINFDNDNLNILISGNLLETTGPTAGRDGVDFDFDNTGITITANTINIAGGGFDNDGIDFEDGNRDITISGNTITIADGGREKDGIDIFFDNHGITIANNIISVGDNIDGGDGIEIVFDNTDIEIANNTINTGDDGNDGNGIRFFDGNIGVTITNNTINIGDNGIDKDGIEFLLNFLGAIGNSDITIANNIINVGRGILDGDGIFFGLLNTEIDIANNTITIGSGSALRDGIELLLDNTVVAITGNMITPGIAGNGISMGVALFPPFPGNNDVEINDNVFNGPGNAVILSFDNSNSANGVDNVATGTFTNPCIGNFSGSVAFNGFSCP